LAIIRAFIANDIANYANATNEYVLLQRGKHRHVVIMASSAFKETSVASSLCRAYVEYNGGQSCELSNNDTCASSCRGCRGIRISLSGINREVAI